MMMNGQCQMTSDLLNEASADGKEILIGLIVALVSFASGYAWQGFRKLRTLRAALHFWKPILKEKIVVVVGRHNEFVEFEQSGFIGTGDARALADLEKWFRNIGFDNYVVMYSEEVGDSELEENIISLGGPDANSISYALYSRFENTDVKFGDKDKYEISIHGKCGTYSPRVSGGEGVDFGAIFLRRNPFKSSRWCLLIAGSYGYGTWAGVRFLTSSDMPMLRHVTSVPVELIITADVIRGYPKKIETVEVHVDTQNNESGTPKIRQKSAQLAPFRSGRH